MVAAVFAAPFAPQHVQMEDGAWDRAVEQAQGGELAGEVQTLTLDGVVKCPQGKLPKARVFAPFTQLKRLSIANVGLSSLADFPSLPQLERLILSDNRIAGGLEHLVFAGLTSLRELDLSNNKIQAVEDLKPLAQFKLESLDLYECTVTRSVDYRAKVFGIMKSLRFLDKTDVTGKDRPESDEESEDEEDVGDFNGHGLEAERDEEVGIEVDSAGVALQEEEGDEEGEEDEERDDEGEDNEELEDEEEDESGSCQEEIVAGSGRGVVHGYVKNDHGSDEDADDEDDNVEVQDVDGESEEEEDAAVEEEEEDEDEAARGAHVSTDGELDVQENEEDNEDDNGELGEDGDDNDAGEEEVEDEDEEEVEYGTKYLVQPIGHPEEDEGASDFEPGEDDEEDEDLAEGDDDEGSVKEPVGLKQVRKRTREETGDREERPTKY